MGLYQALDSANIQKAFYNGLEAGTEQLWAAKLAYMNDGSDRATEEYNWLGQVAPLRQWIGGRAEKFFNKYAMTISNFVYESTHPVDVNDVRRDKTGLIYKRIGEMGIRAQTHWNSLGATLYQNGNGTVSGLAYDGANFFSASHNESGTSQSNLLTSSDIPAADVVDPTNPTPTEAANILNQAIGYFQSLTDDQGEPINGSMPGITVLCPRYTIASAFNIAANPTITSLVSGATNPVRALTQNIDVQFSPRFTAANVIWVILQEPSTYRSIIFQDEQGVELQQLAAGSDEAVKYDRYIFGVRAARGFGFGAWQKAIRIALS